MNRIDKPKVFISYAWSSDEYKENVLHFAGDLMNDGIDVVLDRWSLREGHDTNAFMERSVTDESITNVIILLDPVYAEKANNREGGVGTEAQIISPEIYQKVNQEKFIPVVFERDVDGNICIPVFLRSTFHRDLSQSNNYNEEYQALVRRLYGVDTIEKPKLGNRPSWVDKPVTVSLLEKNQYSSLVRISNENIRDAEFNSYLNNLTRELLSVLPADLPEDITDARYLECMDSMHDIRNKFLLLLEYVPQTQYGYKNIAREYESIYHRILAIQGYKTSMLRTVLHELFIYTVAMYFKNYNTTALAYMLGKNYVDLVYGKETFSSFRMFNTIGTKLDKVVSARDGKQYLSGTACYWLDNVNVSICSKDDFIFADELCYNASILYKGINKIINHPWFPVTYASEHFPNLLMRRYAERLKSKEYIETLSLILGYDNIDELKKVWISYEESLKHGKFVPLRYQNAFGYAPFVCEYIKSDELGIIN